MRTQRVTFLPFVFAAVLLSSTTSCTGIFPSFSHGTSSSHFKSLDALPKTIEVDYREQFGFPGKTGSFLSSELSRLGFSTVNGKSDAEAVFLVEVALIQYGLLGFDAELNATLINRATRTTLWEAKVYRNYEVYSGYTEAWRSVMQKLVDMLKADIEDLKQRK